MNLDDDKSIGDTVPMKTLVTNSSLAQVLEPLGDALNAGIMTFDARGRLVFINKAAQSLLGLPADMLTPGRNLSAILTYGAKQNYFGEALPIAAVPALCEKIKQECRAGKLTHTDWVLTNEDGHALKITRIACADGQLLLHIENVSKTTKLSDIIDIAYSTDKNGHWTYDFTTQKFRFSDNILSFFDADEVTEIENKGLWSFVHPDDVAKAQKAWRIAFANNETMDFVCRIQGRKFGTFYLRNIGHPQYSTNGKPLGVICFVNNVTELLETQNALKSAKDIAESTLSANNDFLAKLSHEIRTPMNGIMGMTDALMMSDQNGAISEQLRVIKSSAENLMRVMNDTLEHARLESAEIQILTEPASPKDILTNLARMWQTKARENGTTVKIHLDSALPDQIMIDPFRFEQCINNLMSNAVKFTANGSVSLISTVVMKNGTPRFVTAVKDTGIGMTPKQQENIFVPYKQADDTISSRFGGTGLGMAITKNIVDGMGGSIQIKSLPGEGTTFALSVPLIKVENDQPLDSVIDAIAPPPEPTTLDITAPSLSSTPPPFPDALTKSPLIADGPDMGRISKLSVLVAEDNSTNQLVVRSLLDPVLGQMHFAANGQEAIDILSVQPIDIVLMDIHMPVMDGIEASLKIRAEATPYQNVPIIALTADPEYQQKRICKNIGMDDALGKPVNRDEILEAFDKVLTAREEARLAPEQVREAG